jgi:hypothetical protein
MEEIVITKIQPRTLFLQREIPEDAASGFDLEAARYS